MLETKNTISSDFRLSSFRYPITNYNRVSPCFYLYFLLIQFFIHLSQPDKSPPTCLCLSEVQCTIGLSVATGLAFLKVALF